MRLRSRASRRAPVLVAASVALLAQAIAPSAASAATYYVAESGDDGNPGTELEPFRTIVHGAAALGPGDTLLVRAGTYAEELYNGIRGGTSWSNATTLVAYPGETVVIRPPAGASRVLTFADAAARYVVVRGFVLDAANVTIDAVKVTWGSATGASHHIRLEDCEVMNAPGQGILVTGNEEGAVGNEFVRLEVHDNGTTDFDHGFYLSTSDNLVEGCEVYRNAGWGVHVYSSGAVGTDTSGTIVRNNRVHDNARAGARGVGIGLYSGTGVLAYNNLVWGNVYGVAVDYGAIGAGVYHNVIHANARDGILVGSEASGTLIENNIVLANEGGVADSGSGTVLEANLVDVDPLFRDAAARDYHLQAGSPAIDQGVVVADAPLDLDGVPRPQGAAPDIGAYEYVAPGADAGAPADGGAASDAGAPADGGTASDAGLPADAAANDGGGGGEDAAPHADARMPDGGNSSVSSGCGCAASGRAAGGPLAALLLLLALARRARALARRAGRR